MYPTNLSLIASLKTGLLTKYKPAITGENGRRTRLYSLDLDCFQCKIPKNPSDPCPKSCSGRANRPVLVIILFCQKSNIIIGLNMNETAFFGVYRIWVNVVKLRPLQAITNNFICKI